MELLEARRPKGLAVITEIDGQVKYGDVAKRGLKENVIMGRLIPAGTGME